MKAEPRRSVDVLFVRKSKIQEGEHPFLIVFTGIKRDDKTRNYVALNTNPPGLSRWEAFKNNPIGPIK